MNTTDDMATVRDLPPVFLRLEDVKRVSGYSTSGVYDAMQRGVFPRPRKRGTTSIWVAAEVMEALARDVAELPVAEAQATRKRPRAA